MMEARDDRTLQLLGGFAFRAAGQVVDVARAGQRVLAYVALCGGSVHRSTLAGTLWPDRPEGRALANLRGALWRLPTPARDQVSATAGTVNLDADLGVDVDRTTHAANVIRAAGPGACVDRSAFMADLLPDWDEADWLFIARERHRQLRLHALEDLAHAELDADRPLDAVDTALCAVAVEPLRESAQLIVIRGHIAAGNRVAALRQFDRFRTMLADELQLDPSPQMLATVAPLRPGGDVGVTASGSAGGRAVLSS